MALFRAGDIIEHYDNGNIWEIIEVWKNDFYYIKRSKRPIENTIQEHVILMVIIALKRMFQRLMISIFGRMDMIQENIKF